MKINQENYEEYFLDYSEGSLSPEMEKELMLFLEVHPDLRPFLESFDASPLSPVDTKSESLKQRLKKNIRPTIHINEAHIDEWLISEAEGLLSEHETAELNDFLARNPAYEYDRKVLSLAKAIPDPGITFARKNQLKRKTPVFTLNRLAWMSSVAAVLILITFGIRYFHQSEIIEIPQVIQTAAKPVTEAEVPVPARMESRGTPSPVTPSQVATRCPSFRMERNRPITSVPINPSVPDPVNLAFFSPEPILFETDQNEQPLLAKILGRFIHKSRNAVRKNPSLENFRNADIDIWSIAEAGVKGFSAVTDRDLELLVRRDERGRIKSYALIEDDRLLVTKNRDNN